MMALLRTYSLQTRALTSLTRLTPLILQYRSGLNACPTPVFATGRMLSFSQVSFNMLEE